MSLHEGSSSIDITQRRYEEVAEMKICRVTEAVLLNAQGGIRGKTTSRNPKYVRCGQGGSGIPQARPSGSVHAKEISEIQTSFVNNNHTSPTSSASFTSINNNRVATTTLPPTPRAPSIETPTCETSTATSVDWIPPVVFHYALPWQTSMPLQNARNLKHSRVLALYGVCPHLMPPSKATVISSRCRR
ncbi:hypothetical protein M7I_1673 [Glarea lozoyensis 74030]|uniref:Uncharacterized protein n=1 Tax=Glarea lozoyensis (strain ATCC 74030 / MF5533) TaxID=1104152 RepID=H0EGQ4_GLAL7|nr:hypothetical protein M7I_1673 [Glarea lozoyensis 74030]